MPVYEYECKTCNTVFDVRVASYRDPIEPVCDKCGSRQAKKRFTAPNVIANPSSDSAGPCVSCCNQNHCRRDANG